MVVMLMEFVNFGMSVPHSGAPLVPLAGFGVIVAAIFHGLSPLAWRVRTALALPLVHIWLAVVAIVVWEGTDVSQLFPEIGSLDRPGLGAGLVGALVALVVALGHQQLRKRRVAPGWLRPLVVFLLGYLFVLGVSLPVFTNLVPSASSAWILAAPALPALLFLIVGGWHSSVRASTATWWAGVGVISASALVAGQASEAEMVAHGGYLGPMVGVGTLALGCLVALAVTQWRELRFHRGDALRGKPWVQMGRAVTADNSPPALFRFRGWLAGFRSEVRDFTLTPLDGGMPVVVPARSHLCAPLPPHSVDAEPGEAFLALASGMVVVATGFESLGEAGPFRTGAGVVPSDAGVVVAGTGRPSNLHAIALLMWRPCTLYLAVSAAVLVPFIIGVLGLE